MIAGVSSKKAKEASVRKTEKRSVASMFRPVYVKLSSSFGAMPEVD